MVDNSYILERFLEKKVSYSSENIDLAIYLLITQNNEIDDVMTMLYCLLGTNSYSAEGIEAGWLEVYDRWDGQNLAMILCTLLETKECSLKVIKETLFDKNGKLKQEFNSDIIKQALKENYYLDKEILKELNFTEEAKELSEKYQAQKEWSIEEYQKDYIKIHNTETCLDVNMLIGKNIMKLLAKLTQYYFDENITHMIFRYLDGNVDDTIKNIYKAIIDAPKKQKAIEEKKQVIPGKESCEDPNKETHNEEDDNDDNDNDGQGGGNGGNDSIKEGRQLLNDSDGKYRIDDNGNIIDKMEEESDEMNREDIDEVQEEGVEVSSGIIEIVIDIEQPMNFLMKNESEVEEAEENVGAFLFIGPEKGNAAIVIGGIGSNKELPEDYDLINEEVPTIYDSNHYMF